MEPTSPTFYVATLGVLVIGLLHSISQWKEKKFITKSIVGWSVLLGWIGITQIVSKSLFQFEWLISVSSLFILYSTIRKLSSTSLWFPLCLALLGLTQGIYGIGQYFYFWDDIAAPSFRISGSFDNPAGFAAMLTACFPFALHLIGNQKWYFKLSGAVTAMGMVVAVGLAQSRAGVVGLTCVSALWVFGLLPDKWKRILTNKVVILVSVVIVLLLACGLYVWKKDSADGRLLIWQCSAKMIADKPILGHGIGSFQREYMLYQADYFRQHPTSEYTQLADIVKHPFNEYLLWWIEQGLVGVVLCGCFGWLIIRAYRRNSDKTEKRVYMLCLIGIAVFACFSYPLNYPFVRLLLVFSTAMIMQEEKNWVAIPVSVMRITKPLFVLLLCGLIALTGKMFYNEYYWNKIARRSLAGETREVLPEYARLYPWMRGEGLFLYNYAAELNYIGEWKQSNQLMTECSQRYNDNDVQLILADNYLQQKQYIQAEKHLQLAYQMIPCRFTPLYRLAQLYQLQGRTAEAHQLAKVILLKPVKVPSPEIMDIKEAIRKL